MPIVYDATGHIESVTAHSVEEAGLVVQELHLKKTEYVVLMQRIERQLKLARKSSSTDLWAKVLEAKKADVQSCMSDIASALGNRSTSTGIFTGTELVEFDAAHHEFLEMLHSMIQQGQDIQTYVQSLSLSPSNNVLLQSASLPTREGILLILDYLETREVAQAGETYLAQDHLPDLGIEANELLLLRLQDMVDNPQQHFELREPSQRQLQEMERAEQVMRERNVLRDLSSFKGPRYRTGYINLFRAAAHSGDTRFIPKFQQLEEKFKDSPDPSVAAKASQSRWLLEDYLERLALVMGE